MHTTRGHVQETCTLQTRRKRKHGYVEIHFSPKPTSIKPRYPRTNLYVCIQGTVQYTFEYIHIFEIKREERRKEEVKE